MTVAVRVAESLMRTGRASHPDLGPSAQAMIVEGPSATPPGLHVTAVTAGGPAAQAGIAVGDVIVEVDGQPATSPEQLVLTTLTHAAGETVPFTVWRSGALQTVTVTLGPAP